MSWFCLQVSNSLRAKWIAVALSSLGLCVSSFSLCILSWQSRTFLETLVLLPSFCPRAGPKTLSYSSVMKLFWLLFASDWGWFLLFVRLPTVLQRGMLYCIFALMTMFFLIVVILELHLTIPVLIIRLLCLHTISRQQILQFNYMLFQRFLSVKCMARCMLPIL